MGGDDRREDHVSSITIASPDFTVEIAAAGAELQRVQDTSGRDWLWDGDPAFWTGRAPILFPIVGALAGNVARIGDRDFSMEKHGFARRSVFEIVSGRADCATLRLEPTDATRAAYPFDFRLDVTHRIDGLRLTTTAVVHNAGREPMPASFGFHPALRWPLPGPGARADHVVIFDEPEREPLRGVDPDGLIPPATVPTPVSGRTLALADALFAHDALVFDCPRSRGLFYGVPGAPGVRVDFPDMPMLGIWTKPGAGYLCIEPWAGHADPSGYQGQFADKPGMRLIAPGEQIAFEMALTFGATA
jgi:galactose mutarotase-like enzyme